MANLYWLASYPKSGNTWMRILLTNYLRQSDTPADINSLDGGPIASARQIFDDLVGIESSDFTHAEIERYRPQAFTHFEKQLSTPQFLKVHDAFTLNDDGVPLMPREATGGVIYLLRNPFDVAISYAHHSAHDNYALSVSHLGNQNHVLASAKIYLTNQFPQRLLTWSAHVTSWVDHSKLPVLVVRYEDLLADTVAIFHQVVQFVGLELDEIRLQQAVEFSRFDRLQKQETESGFREKIASSSTFFRSGQSGSWRDKLSNELVQQLIKDHEPVMKRFGYLTEAGEPVF